MTRFTFSVIRHPFTTVYMATVFTWVSTLVSRGVMTL